MNMAEFPDTSHSPCRPIRRADDTGCSVVRAPYHVSKPYWTRRRTLLVQAVNPTAGILSGTGWSRTSDVEKRRTAVTTPSASRIFK